MRILLVATYLAQEGVFEFVDKTAKMTVETGLSHRSYAWGTFRTVKGEFICGWTLLYFFFLLSRVVLA